ncbi:hypothetical protein ACWGKW_24645 [Streptomyces sp. NPDC054766]
MRFGSAGPDAVDEAPYADGVDGAPYADDPDDESDPEHERPGSRRWLGCAGVVGAVLALMAGGFVWLFQDELFHPFGDTRACDGSESRLPNVISAGGVPIPADASDIHYVTRNGVAEVSFLSDLMPDYLHRAGVVPEGTPLPDERYGSPYGLGDGDSERPEGLCGPALRGPAWSYQATGTDGGPGAEILIERSSIDSDSFRTPARVIVSFATP